MIYTQSELDISNKSYTNKDFESIYLELMDYADKLSKRFSPKDSNESDPYIVLLKLLAFVADKVNYNIDKNILENFILTCTQQTSLNALTDMLGYSCKYYQSAKTDVFFRYPFTRDDKKNEATRFIKVPKHSILTDSTSKIQYITLDDALINAASGTSTAVTAIEGVLKTFQVLGSSSVLLENLNAMNRLYFPERMIAENGIFISNSIFSDSWKKVENLTLAEYGSAVYKFGYDSTLNLPYLEFPTWIASIIGDGLTVKYLITSGVAGNIAPNSLISLTRVNITKEEDKKIGDRDINDSDIGIIQLSAATSGADIESIESSYQNLRRNTGVFNTLVTCRDYANTIFNMLDGFDNNYVSNVIVADRRTDLNYSSNVLTLINSEPQCVHVENDSIQINAYDLCMYLFAPIKSLLGLPRNDKVARYNEAYGLAKYDVILPELVDKLELNNSAICHDYKKLKEGDIVSIENQYLLKGIITTKNKVTEMEAEDILLQVESALMSTFTVLNDSGKKKLPGLNSRTLTFGEEIPYDTLVDTIIKSDSRIKSVSLEEPTQTPYIRTISGVTDTNNNSALDTSYSTQLNPLFGKNGASESFKFIVAKNVLEGKISLFTYDESFDYNFTYQNVKQYKDIEKIETEWVLEQDSADSDVFTDTGYILRENEVIQFLAPNMIDEISYPYGVEYAFKKAAGDRFVPKNSVYKLQEGDKLLITYKDNSSIRHIKEYPSSESEEEFGVICPTFDLYDTEYMNTTLKRTPNDHTDEAEFMTEYAGYKFFTIDSDGSIDYKILNRELLDSGYYCYWIMDNPENKISWEYPKDGAPDKSQASYLLRDGEYFIFTDNSFASLFMYGSGSRLIIADEKNNVKENMPAALKTGLDAKIAISEINTLGLNGMLNAFQYIDFNSSLTLEAIQNDLITLIEGDSISIKIDEKVTDANIGANDFKTLIKPERITYTTANEVSAQLSDRSTLPDLYQWQGRTILDLNMSPTMPQHILSNQRIIFPDVKDENNESLKISPDGDNIINIKSNAPLQVSGGRDIELRQYNIELDRFTGYNFITYDSDQNTKNKISITEKDLSVVNLTGLSCIDLPYKFSVPTVAIDSTDLTKGYKALPIYFDVASDAINNEGYGRLVIKKNTEASKTKSFGCAFNDLSDLPSEAKEFDNLFSQTENIEEWVLDIKDITAERKSVYWKPTDVDGNDLILSEGDQYSNYILSIEDYTDEKGVIHAATLKIAPNMDLESSNKEKASIDLHLENGSEPEEDGKTADYAYKLFAIDFRNNAKDESLELSAYRVNSDKEVVDIEGICQFNKAGNINSYKKDMSISEPGMYIIKCLPEVKTITLSKSPAVESNAKISISNIKFITGMNKELGLGDDCSLETFIDYLQDSFAAQFEQFYILGKADVAKQIDLPRDTTLADAVAFYDVNNVANAYTLPKLIFTDDLKKSGLSIAKSSIKYR